MQAWRLARGHGRHSTWARSSRLCLRGSPPRPCGAPCAFVLPSRGVGWAAGMVIAVTRLGLCLCNIAPCYRFGSADVKAAVDAAVKKAGLKSRPKCLVIGALGRCGGGLPSPLIISQILNPRPLRCNLAVAPSVWQARAMSRSKLASRPHRGTCPRPRPVGPFRSYWSTRLSSIASTCE
jgi:hypothetical protein